MRILKLLPIFALIYAGVMTAPTMRNNAQTPIVTSAADGTLRRLRVPILMYHYVEPLVPDAGPLRSGLTVSPDQFRSHLELLKTQGYDSVSLYEVSLALTQGYKLPANPVVITFDDGYANHLTTVVPALREYGFIGTFFIITGFADGLRDGYLTWPQVSQVAAAGMEIASHSKSHPDLQRRDHDFLVYEILGSTESIRANAGTAANSFAYPMGRYDEAVIDMLKQTGIKAAVTTAHGATHTTDTVLEMSRLRVQNTTGVPGLAVLLREK